MLLCYVASFNNSNSRFIKYLGRSKNNRLNIFHFIALLLISIVAGFRYQVGNDWMAYKRYYDRMINSLEVRFDEQTMEYGYYVINKIFSQLELSHVFVFFVAAYLGWYFVFKSVPARLLPLSLFFLFTDEQFFLSMNLVRQFIAMGIFLFALRYVTSRSLFKYILMIMLASFFHYSAIILLLVYFLPFKKMYNQYVWAGIFIVTLLLSGNQTLIESFLNALFYVTGQYELAAVYHTYFLSESFLRGVDSVGLGFYFSVVMSFVILYFSKEIIVKYPNSKQYFILFFIGVVIFNMFYMFMIIVRINNYFMILKSILLALTVYHLWSGNGLRKSLGIAIMVLYIVLFIASMSRSARMCCPYQFGF